MSVVNNKILSVNNLYVITDMTVGGDVSVGNDLICGENLYSTGTWTPTIGDGSTNFNMVEAVGSYVLINNDLCFVQADLRWDSITGASGNIVVSLPFSASTTKECVIPVGYVVRLLTGSDTYNISLKHSSGSAFNIIRNSKNAAPVISQHGQFSSTGELQFSGFYYIDNS